MIIRPVCAGSRHKKSPVRFLSRGLIKKAGGQNRTDDLLFTPFYGVNETAAIIRPTSKKNALLQTSAISPFGEPPSASGKIRNK